MAKCEWKKSGGIVVITKTSLALSRWVLSYNLGSHIWCANINELFFIHHNDCLIHRESAWERQIQDNSAESVLHHKTLGCSSLRQKILPATDSCPSCSKGQTQVEKPVQSNGGFFKDIKITGPGF